MRHRRVPVALLVLGLVGVLAFSCSGQRALPLPGCEPGSSGWIAAQSVPAAELAPCFDPLPAGWEVEKVIVDQNGTLVRLDSDRAGTLAAELRFRESCDLGAAVAIPSDQDGADAFEYIERINPGFSARRYYVFPGGCVWWEFDFDEVASAALSIELGDALSLVPRAEVGE